MPNVSNLEAESKSEVKKELTCVLLSNIREGLDADASTLLKVRAYLLNDCYLHTANEVMDIIATLKLLDSTITTTLELLEETK